MFIKTISKTLIKVVAIIFFAQAAYAEITLKLGTTGRLGMPIGDAIDQALIPARSDHRYTDPFGDSLLGSLWVISSF